jgi:hypothetical protein
LTVAIRWRFYSTGGGGHQTIGGGADRRIRRGERLDRMHTAISDRRMFRYSGRCVSHNLQAFPPQNLITDDRPRKPTAPYVRRILNSSVICIRNSQNSARYEALMDGAAGACKGHHEPGSRCGRCLGGCATRLLPCGVTH